MNVTGKISREAMRACVLAEYDLVAAGHHDYGAELQPFSEMHRADRNDDAGRLGMVVENLGRQSRRFDRVFVAVELHSLPHEEAELVWQDASLLLLGQPRPDGFDFLAIALEHSDRVRRAVENEMVSLLPSTSTTSGPSNRSAC